MFRRGRIRAEMLLLALLLLPLLNALENCSVSSRGGVKQSLTIEKDREVPEQLVAYRYSSGCEFGSFFFNETDKKAPESFHYKGLDATRGTACARNTTTFFSLGDGQRGVKLERTENGKTIHGTLFKIQYEGSTELWSNAIISQLDPEDSMDLGHCFVDLSMIYCPVQPKFKNNGPNGHYYVLLRFEVVVELEGERLKLFNPPLLLPFRINHAKLEMVQYDRALMLIALSQEPFETWMLEKSSQEGDEYAIESRSLYSLHRRGYLSMMPFPGRSIVGIHSFDRSPPVNRTRPRGRCTYSFIGGRHTAISHYEPLITVPVCAEMTIYRTSPLYNGLSHMTPAVFTDYLPVKEDDVRFQPFVQKNTQEIRETWLKMRDYVAEVCTRFKESWKPKVECGVLDYALYKMLVVCGVLLLIFLVLVTILVVYLMCFVRRRRLVRRRQRRERRHQRQVLQRSVMGLPPLPEEVNVDLSDEKDKDKDKDKKSGKAEKKKDKAPVKIFKDLTQVSSSESEGKGGADTKQTEGGETAFFSAREQFNVSKTKTAV